MIVIMILLGVYALLGAGYWLMTAYGAVRLWRDVPKLGETNLKEPERWPTLSVVVPACEEADKLEPAFRTLMGQDYPELELILVNDRSTDGTGTIADRLAAEDGRVRVIHIKELPAGWLGKVNALQQGYASSTGELVLFTDADVNYAPGTLRKAAAYFLDRKLDHMTVIPHLWTAGLLTDAIVSAFLRPFVALVSRPWKVSDPKSSAFMGVGAFNLVRREAFEKTEGLEWLKMEVGDDMGLGLLMKRSGARCEVVSALDEIGLAWHRTVGEALRGSEKGYAPACQFSLARSVAAAVIVVGVEFSPIVLLAALAWSPLRGFGVAGAALTAVAVGTTVGMARLAHWRVLPSVLSPIGALIGAWAIVRAAILGKRRDGVDWRGTHYPTETLKQGMRLNLSLKGTAEDVKR